MKRDPNRNQHLNRPLEACEMQSFTEGDKMPDEIENREEKIDRVLFLMAEIYEKQLTNEALKLYHLILKPFSVAEIERACKTWMESYEDKKYNFYPKPNQIIETIQIDKIIGAPVKVRAQQQWRVILQQIRYHGPYHPPKFTDPITQHLIDTQFRWSYLCNMIEAEQHWQQKQWCDAYELAAEIQKDLKKIEIPDRVMNLVDKIGNG